jgi:thymidylate synthase ThyX
MMYAEWKAKHKRLEAYALEREGPPLTAEEIAVAMAKTSRSPNSFRVSADLVTQESAATFHDKYVLAYGHASVAELASAHACFENISMLGAKALEDQRLGAYIEASTRYQIWTRDSFMVPFEMDHGEHHPLRERYTAWCYRLFDSYLSVHAKLLPLLAESTPRPEGMSEGLWKTNLKAKACDLARGLLPAGATTNVGWAANARVADHTITKLCSHPLLEAVYLGCELKRVTQKQLPTLVKYGKANRYRIEHRERMEAIARNFERPRVGRDPFIRSFGEPFVELVPPGTGGDVSPHMLDLLATAIFPHCTAPTASYYYIRSKLNKLTKGELEGYWKAIFEHQGDRDAAPRCVESAPFVFEMDLDFGAWRDLQRHRMMSQFDQPLTPYLGFHIPDAIRQLGGDALYDEYRNAVQGTADMYDEMRSALGPYVAQYVIPMGFAKRCVFKMNLRQLAAIIELRSKPGGHLNYRRAAVAMWKELQRVEPWMADAVRVSFEGVDDDLKRIKEVKP